MTRMVLSFLLTINIYASPTELGNGNDGGDLIEFREIKEGPILDAREMAVKQLSRINLRGIQGLGYLKDEVEKTKLYITKDGLTVKDLLELGAFKEGSNPIVYARTFPRPHAATRFFPAATSLTKAQLVAVHIHEGLHRSLPPEIRSDEKIVEEITKVITSPNSTFEDIIYVMNAKLPTKPLLSKEPANETITLAKNQVSELPKSNSNEGFFKQGFLEVRNEAFSGEDLYLWNNARVIVSDSDVYTWDKSKLKLMSGLYSFKDLLGGYADIYANLGLAYETEDDDTTWGYRFNLGAGGYTGAYGNPLERWVRTFEVDWVNKYETYDLKLGFRYTPGDSAPGSMNKIKNPDVTILDDEFSYNEVGIASESSIYDETSFGNIYTFDLEVARTWDNGISLMSGLALHYMDSFGTTDTETYDDPDFSFSNYRQIIDERNALPVLRVLNLGASYEQDSILVSLKYMMLLNSSSGENSYNLTNLGDPVGRGLGNSSLSLSIGISI